MSVYLGLKYECCYGNQLTLYWSHCVGGMVVSLNSSVHIALKMIWDSTGGSLRGRATRAAPWLCECEGVWVCGCVGVRVCGCVGVRVCGYVGVWVWGCEGVRVWRGWDSVRSINLFPSMLLFSSCRHTHTHTHTHTHSLSHIVGEIHPSPRKQFHLSQWRHIQSSAVQCNIPIGQEVEQPIHTNTGTNYLEQNNSGQKGIP